MRKLRLFLPMVLFLATALCHADETTNLNCGVHIDFNAQSHINIGSNVLWRVSLSNASATTWTCLVSMNVDAVGYNGETWGDVSLIVTTNVLAAGATGMAEMTVTPSNYAAWPRASLLVVVGVELVETNDLWLTSARADIITPTNILFLAPQPPINVGGCVTAQVSCLNPYPVALQDVKVYLTADETFSTNNTVSEHEFSLGMISTNASIAASTNFVARAAGTGHIWATITASNLADISTSLDVPVTE